LSCACCATHPVGKAQAGEARESWGCLQLLSCLSSLQRGDACKHFGSLVGLLVPLLCDPMPTSRQLAATCLNSLLRLQAKATNRVIQAGDIGSLCEGLNDCSTVRQLQTASKIVRVSGPKRDGGISLHFMMVIKDTFQKATGMCVRAAGKWMITFLQMYGKDIRREFDLSVITYMLRSCMSSLQHSTFVPFLCQAVAILTPVTQTSQWTASSTGFEPTNSEMWRRIREFSFQWGSREKKEKKGEK
ncbi:hypothetical protein CIB84_016623, partial [Bambusicola thoracicus]